MEVEEHVNAVCVPDRLSPLETSVAPHTGKSRCRVLPTSSPLISNNIQRKAGMVLDPWELMSFHPVSKTPVKLSASASSIHLCAVICLGDIERPGDFWKTELAQGSSISPWSITTTRESAISESITTTRERVIVGHREV